MSASDDAIGRELIAHLRAILEPGDACSESSADGFTWWPGPFAQRITAEPARPSGGIAVHRVSAECALVQGVGIGGAAFGVLARWNAREAGLSALRWNAETGEVSLHCAFYVHAGELELARARLAHAALLQIGDAARIRTALAAELGGTPAPEAAPGRAVRTEPDALCEAWRAYAEAGLKPGAGPGAAALQAASQMTAAPWVRVRVDAGGLQAELPAALPGGAQPGSAPGAGVALLRLVTAQPHPRLGAGLLAVLEPPPDAEPVRERAAATAALLNEGEAREWTGCDALGAWCVHPDRGLVHVLFVPALMCDAAMVEDTAWRMALRATWSRRFLAHVAALRAGSGA